MYPYITFLGDFPTFTLMAVIGALAMLWFVYRSIEADARETEVAFIFPRLVAAGGIGFFSAALTDFLFKFAKYGELRPYGITFYGGMIGGAIAMYLLLRLSKVETRYTRLEWFNHLAPAFILFHVFGRIGCFLGGCCYGRESDSFLAVVFPDNPDNGFIHNGVKCLPTQLFEAAALIVILLIVLRCKNRMRAYLYLYAPTRFCLEFLRGDDRGDSGSLFSPSQWISLLIISALLIYEISRVVKKKKELT